MIKGGGNSGSKDVIEREEKRKVNNQLWDKKFLGKGERCCREDLREGKKKNQGEDQREPQRRRRRREEKEEGNDEKTKTVW